jgi:23S rRNA G2445 N2-methylase RlmL
VRFACRVADVRQLQAHQPPPLVVTNPPDGLRLAEGGAAFSRELAAAVCRLHGWRVGLLTVNPTFLTCFE